MFSRFFIDRPIFAAVLSIVITLAGIIARYWLPLAQYPQITPPTVQVNCQYPGANAEVVAETIAAPIEQQVNGVERMLYMSSQSTNDGSYNLTVTFEHGVNIDMAQVLVQNRVSLALPLLPPVIQQTGVTTKKKSPDILMAISLISPNGTYDQLYLSNYALLQVRDVLARLPGVSDVTLFGQRDYSMRIWVDSDKLAARGLGAGDVAAALREQNLAVALGQLGQQPTPRGQEFQIPMSTLGRLVEPEQFGNIVLRTTSDGRVLRLKDVSRVELGAKNIDVNSRVNGLPTVSIAIWQLPDANAFDTADVVRAKMEDLRRSFPDDLEYVIRYDTTPFIKESIQEVFKTLRDAIILVAVVVLLFLQNWRSALIPLIAVPVAIIGTFAVMAVFGYSLNNLTLFGLVLAIGIVVDDAIVVVEAVEHHIEHGLPPRAATIKAMEQVTGPVIAVGLVLSAVFVPCTFIGGITGQFFRQFAMTIAVSTIISTFNSLTLSPALAALLLKHREKGVYEPLPRLAFVVLGGWLASRCPQAWLTEARAWVGIDWPADWPDMMLINVVILGGVAGWFLGRPLNWALGMAFRLFNAGFDWATGRYIWGVGVAVRLTMPVLLVYAGLLFLTWSSLRGFPDSFLPDEYKDMKVGSLHLAHGIPKGFIPQQDQGFLLINVQLPDAASDERTQTAMNKLVEIARNTPGIRHTVAISGTSFVLGAYGSNFGSMFVILDPFDERRSPELYGDMIAAKLRKDFRSQVREAEVAVFGPPPVRGVGTAGGFKIMLEDRGDLGYQNLQEISDLLGREGNKSKSLVGLFGLFRANVPQIFIDLNREQCMSLHVPFGAANDTLEIYLGSLYVNDFNRFGRTWQVNVQADSQFRNTAAGLRRFQVRSDTGDMVPLGALIRVREVTGPLLITRYNMYPTAFLNGSAAFGISSGEAIIKMEEITAKHLPVSMAYEWTEMAFLEQKAGSTAMMMFFMSVVFVFLVLAALYESWSLPLTIILVVPMCMFSAIVGVIIAKMDINIFTQVGFVVLVGLASKNAILIVEYAKVLRDEGMPRMEATLTSCRLRLRPIIMTSFAFILGVVPLLLAEGAGAEMRRTLGTAVFSGMLGVTLFGIFLTPVFFYVMDAFGEVGLFASRTVKIVMRLAMFGISAGLGIFLGIYFHLALHEKISLLFFTIVAPWLVLGLGKLLRQARSRRTW